MNFYLKHFICFILAACLFSCASTSVSNIKNQPTEKKTIPEPALPSYQESVSQLGQELLAELLNLEKEFESKSFFIYNASVKKHEESALAGDLINDLMDFLTNKGTRIKRKEIIDWARATSLPARVNCQEVLETIASNYLIEFSLKECTDANDCLLAAVRIFSNKSNTVLDVLRQSFHLNENLKKKFQQMIKLASPKGTRFEPYTDSYEAANYITGKLLCILNNMSTSGNSLRIVVGKTQRTPADIALSFDHALSYYGAEKIPFPETWLPVIINTRDTFELSVFKKEYNQALETANLVLSIDKEIVNRGLYRLRVQLITLNSVEITDSKGSKILEANMVIPNCAGSGFVGRIIRATGVGICSKEKWDPGMWQYTAEEAAKVYAKRNLVRKVAEIIRFRSIYQNRTLQQDRVESQVEAFINGARCNSLKFDEQACKAEAECEIEEGNIQPLIRKMSEY